MHSVITWIITEQKQNPDVCMRLYIVVFLSVSVNVFIRINIFKLILYVTKHDFYK